MAKQPEKVHIRVLPDTPRQVAQSFGNGTMAKVNRAFQDRIAYLKRKK